MVRRVALCLSFSVGLVAAMVGPATAAPGDLDPTFGSAGTGLVRTDITPKGPDGLFTATHLEELLSVLEQVRMAALVA